jgi:hypothetical protein
VLQLVLAAAQGEDGEPRAEVENRRRRVLPVWIPRSNVVLTSTQYWITVDKGARTVTV